MPKMMTIAIGMGKARGKGDDAELSEYEQGALDMRDRACALAGMYDAGKRPSKALAKMLEELALDERPSERESNPGGHESDY